MQRLFHQYVHYEIKTRYSVMCIYLHDERGLNNPFRSKLYEIAQWHELMYHDAIGFCCTQKVGDVGYETALTEITKGLQELFNAFNPFFEYLFSVEQNNNSRNELIGNYRVEDDLLSASDVIRRVVNNDFPLDLGDGITMQPSANGKFHDGRTGGRRYKCYLNDGSIHFEVRTDGSEVSVELHDERKKYDGLSQKLHQKAVSCDMLVNINEDVGLWISPKHRIQCRRSCADIISDAAKQMRTLWDVFGPLLDGMTNEGVLKSEPSKMPDLAPPPHPEYGSDVKFRKDISNNTLCWVTSVESLISRKPIRLSNIDPGKVLMRPGQYVIPSYQRRYAWTPGNVNQLCRDLLRAAEQQKSGYHLGTLIFHAPKTENDENTFFVVDGQQRLRTISRLLSQEIFTESNESLPERQFSDENERAIWTILQRFCEVDRNKILNMLRKKSTLVCIAVSEIAESFQLFSTQNGRGKSLSPENLLKAYHFHEIQSAENLSSDELDKMDAEWERLNQKPLPRDGVLLHQVIGEHLYRIRCLLRGNFPPKPFSTKNVNVFKGLTVNTKEDYKNTLPLGNLSVLRRSGDQYAHQLARRSSSDKMNPFVFIDQPIVNGSDFFAYIDTYCKAYETLFGSKENYATELGPFYSYYATHCLYPASGRRGDVYARHIYQSLCLYCYDRFGAKGLNKSCRYLFCCAYYERAVNARCYYQTCGREYASKVIQIMADASTLSDLTDRLCESYLEVCEKFDGAGAVLVNGLEAVHAAFSRRN